MADVTYQGISLVTTPEPSSLVLTLVAGLMRGGGLRSAGCAGQLVDSRCFRLHAACGSIYDRHASDIRSRPQPPGLGRARPPPRGLHPAGTDEDFDQPLSVVDRHGWLGPSIAGLRVLCLAAGGGSQSALYAAAGAKVTVVDISGEMLALDRQVAAERQLDITCIQASMDDLVGLAPVLSTS